MRFPILSILTAGLLVAPLVAQSKPDFSGTWNLNAASSDAPPRMDRNSRPDGERDRPAGGRAGGMGRPTSMFINQMGSKLMIDLKIGDRARTVSYYLDGRESRNPGMRDQEMVTTTRWDGNALVTEGENKVTTPMGEMTIKSKEVRSLSEDGKTMTIVASFTTPRGEMTRKTVYDKQ
jgi:hypothetical protein